MSLRNPLKRGVEVPGDVAARAGLGRGEKVLAGAETGDGTWLIGTRDALLITGPHETRRVPWERVERADWKRDDEQLVVLEVGEFGTPVPRHTLAVTEPGLLLDLVRERVTASVVLQRRVPTDGKRGLFVIARRAPSGTGEITWAYEFDQGVDPADPAVKAAAERGLASAREEIGQ